MATGSVKNEKSINVIVYVKNKLLSEHFVKTRVDFTASSNLHEVRSFYVNGL